MKMFDIPRPAKQTMRSVIAKVLCMTLMTLSVLFDQITKKIVVENMTLRQDIPVIEGVLHWKYIHNEGAAWGILDNHPTFLLVLSTLAILALLVYFIWTNSQRMWWMASIGMVAGGGIGNMIDRVAQGYVVDFISAEFISFPVSFPVFNVADSFVCVGVGLMVFLLIRDMISEIRTEKMNKEADGNKESDHRHE